VAMEKSAIYFDDFSVQPLFEPPGQWISQPCLLMRKGSPRALEQP
jgi:hypothetical protein